MPGICGIVECSPHSEVDQLLDAMLSRMRHAPSYRSATTASDESAGGPSTVLGCIGLGRSDVGVEPVESRDGMVQAVMAGEIYNRVELTAYLSELATGDLDVSSPAALLMHGLLIEGSEFLSRVRGKYTVAVWDAGRRQLILANDAFGMKPLYYAQLDGRLVFASEIKAVLTDPEVPQSQNLRGISQFFSFGHLWGEETFYSEVKGLPPAACLVFDADSERLTITRYWKPQPSALGTLSDREWIDQIDAAFQRSMAEQTLGVEGLALSLSGGMDSRTLLAALPESEPRPLCVSMGMKGSQDHLRASQMARLVGCRHEQYLLDERFLSQFERHLDRMVQLTDGHYLSQCIVLPTLPFYTELGARVLLRGHAGELVHLQKAYNFSHDAAALGIAGDVGLEGWLFKRLRAYMLEDVDAPLFAKASPGEIEQIARETITASLRDSEGWSPPAQRISSVFLSQRLRRETALSLVKFDSQLETRVPYLDPQLIEIILGAPISLKLNDQIQTELLRRHQPEFLRIRNVNTGARVDAGPLARQWGTFKQRVLAKLGVPGYQPYERLGLWLKRELQPVVRSILLSDACLERGVFRADTVRTVVDQHLEGQRNHTFLLLALMIFEHGQRRLDRQWEPWETDNDALRPLVHVG